MTAQARIGVGLYTQIGEGLNIQFVEVVIFFALHPNPARILQAECRANRNGQLQTVKVLYCYTSQTVDERVYQILLRKTTQTCYLVGASQAMELPHFEALLE